MSWSTSMTERLSRSVTLGPSHVRPKKRRSVVSKSEAEMRCEMRAPALSASRDTRSGTRTELTPRSVSRYGTVSRLGGGRPDLGSYPGGPGEGTMTFERISRSHFSAAA